MLNSTPAAASENTPILLFQRAMSPQEAESGVEFVRHERPALQGRQKTRPGGPLEGEI